MEETPVNTTFSQSAVERYRAFERLIEAARAKAKP